MKKGKHLVSLILAAAMAAGLTACGGQTAPQTTAAASEGTKQAEAAAPAESQEKEEASAGKAEVTLSLNHVGATTHPYQYGSERFAELVSEKTGGRIAVEVYPASQIASGAKAIEFVQMGTLDIALESTMAAENFIPEIGVLNLPFLFENADQAFSVLDGDVGNELRAAAEAKGFKILCWMYNGFRDISNSVKPITAPEDLKGLKIRVPESQVFLKTFETLGGVPTPMAISEVFTAMQLKTVDGQENPSAIFVNNKYNEVNDYYSVTHHIFTAEPLIMSLDKFNSFSEEDQTTLLEAARYVFKSPLAWSEEGARFMFIWMTFIAGYVGARKGQHIGVELIQNLFPESIKAGMKVLCDLISIGFFILVLFYCCAQWDKLSAQTSPALKIPMAFVYLGMMLGCFGMAASYFLHIFEVLKKKRGEEAS